MQTCPRCGEHTSDLKLHRERKWCPSDNPMPHGNIVRIIGPISYYILKKKSQTVIIFGEIHQNATSFDGIRFVFWLAHLCRLFAPKQISLLVEDYPPLEPVDYGPVWTNGPETVNSISHRFVHMQRPPNLYVKLIDYRHTRIGLDVIRHVPLYDARSYMDKNLRLVADYYKLPHTEAVLDPVLADFEDEAIFERDHRKPNAPLGTMSEGLALFDYMATLEILEAAKTAPLVVAYMGDRHASQTLFYLEKTGYRETAAVDGITLHISHFTDRPTHVDFDMRAILA